MPVTKAIIGASYDDSGSIEEVIKQIDKEARNEREKSGISNHYFKRSGQIPDKSKGEIQFDKAFNFMLAGAPIISYVLESARNSKLEEICVVGNALTKKIFDHYIEFTNANKEYERFKFIDEGDNLSFENTLKKGKERLNADDNEKVAFIAGDIPLIKSIDKLISDPDNETYDMVFDLNCRENIYGTDTLFDENKCPYNRRWHLPILNDKNSFLSTVIKTFFSKGKTSKVNRIKNNTVSWVKEPNFSVWKLNDKTFTVANTLFKSRKTYRNGTTTSIKNMFKEIWSCYWDKGYSKAIDTFEKLIGLKNEGRNKFIYESLWKKDSKWKKTIWQIPSAGAYIALKWLGCNIPTFNFEYASKIASIGLDCKIKIKAEHEDFGLLGDIDSAEDLTYHEALLRSVKDKTKICPHYENIKNFGSYLVKQENMKDEEMVTSFGKYLNRWFDNFEWLKDKKIYDDNGNYIGPWLDENGKLKNPNKSQLLTVADTLLESYDKSISKIKTALSAICR